LPNLYNRFLPDVEAAAGVNNRFFLPDLYNRFLPDAEAAAGVNNRFFAGCL